MQRPLATILILASLSVITATSATEGNEAQERTKSKLVSRLYQATYGYSEKCSKGTPETAKDFEQELSRFVELNSSLMKLVTESVMRDMNDIAKGQQSLKEYEEILSK